MNRTKTIDVVSVNSSQGYVNPSNKLTIIVETIFKENFVRIADSESILFELEYIPFKQFCQNSFGKCHLSKEQLAHTVALLDKIVSNTEFVLKPNNINRLLVGIMIKVIKFNKLTKFYDKIFNISSSEIDLIEKEVSSWLPKDLTISEEVLNDYIETIYK